VWKAIYHHYQPTAVEADAPPTKAQLGRAAATWAAVSLADKLDTIVGLFAAGEKPTGSRDPYGLRRAAQGVMKILVDGADLFKAETPPNVQTLVEQAIENYQGALRPADEGWKNAVLDFLRERELHLFERRGRRVDESRAATVRDYWKYPASALQRAEALGKARTAPNFERLAILFKRAKNITKDVAGSRDWNAVKAALKEPAEQQLAAEIDKRFRAVEDAVHRHAYLEAMNTVGQLYGPVDKFFVDVLVMAEDPAVRQARLALVATLRDMILNIADIAEIAPDDTKQA
jgi:glycyl-tRNA synthetase beta chain